MNPDISILSPIGRSGFQHGGITPVVLRLTDQIVKTGLRVEYVTFKDSDSPEDMPNINRQVTLYKLGTGSKIKQALRLATYLRRRPPRVLLSAGPRANLIACWSKWLFRSKCRIWLSVHNTISKQFDGMSIIKRKWRIFRVGRLYSKAEGFICVSKGVAEDLMKTVGLDTDQIKVVYNPIVTPDIADKAAAPLLHPWFQSGQPPVVLGVGRLTRQKDFETLVRAFAQVHQQIDCRLVILGDGEERQTLMKLARELNIQKAFDLPGFVDNPYAFMGRAALFVLSSAWEGFGNVLVEAMSVGTPVVATDCPHGPREILLGGQLGTLLPPGQPTILADAIKKKLENKPDTAREKMRAADFAAEISADLYLRYLIQTNGESTEKR